MNLLQASIDLVYRNRCGVCHSVCKARELVCSSCNPNNVLLEHEKILSQPYCNACGENLIYEEVKLCQNCNLYPLPTRHIRSIWSYSDSAERIICAYKYARSTSLASFFASEIIQAIRNGAFPPEARYNWNLILPLPSTIHSLTSRGFSPVGEITKKVSGELGIGNSLLALRTLGNHPLQASLSPNERLKHLKRKFRAERKIVYQKSILLIDDVITSGASITGTALALLDAGAVEIDVISICRSDLFSSLRHSLAEKI